MTTTWSKKFFFLHGFMLFITTLVVTSLHDFFILSSSGNSVRSVTTFRQSRCMITKRYNSQM